MNPSTGYMGFAVETTGGTAVAPTKFLPTTETDFPTENTFIDVKEMRTSRQAMQSYPGAVKPSATFKTGFYGSGAMGVILRGLFGSDTESAVTGSTTSKLHTFSDAATLPYLTLERSDSHGGGILVERLAGCKVETFAVKCEFGTAIEVTVGMQALQFPDATVTAATSPTFPTQNPFLFQGASVKVNGSASLDFKSLSFDFKNTLDRQDALNGSNLSSFLFEGGLECTLTGSLIFHDLGMYNNFASSTNLDILATFVGDSLDGAGTPPTFYTSTFEWTNVQLSKYGVPFVAGNTITADATFKVKFDNTLARSVRATLQNADASGAYAI